MRVPGWDVHPWEWSPLPAGSAACPAANPQVLCPRDTPRSWLSPEVLGEPPAHGLCPHFRILPRAGSPRRHRNCLVIIQCQGRRWAVPALGRQSPSSSHLAGPGTPAPCLHAQPVLGTTQGFPKLWIGQLLFPEALVQAGSSSGSKAREPSQGVLSHGLLK